MTGAYAVFSAAFAPVSLLVLSDPPEDSEVVQQLSMCLADTGTLNRVAALGLRHHQY